MEQVPSHSETVIHSVKTSSAAQKLSLAPAVPAPEISGPPPEKGGLIQLTNGLPLN